MTVISELPVRILPALDIDTRPYWTAGENGHLMITRCADCAYYVHPPVPFCPRCESRSVAPQPVSGRGHIVTFTINHKQWVPGLPVPYILALVAIDEQEDVRLVANITHCNVEDICFGMAVEVWFERVEDVWVPLFRPVAS